MKAAKNAGCESEALERVRKLVEEEVYGERFVTKILSRELGLKPV